MKKLQLSAIKQQVLSCVQTNLVEAILGLCFFILFVIERSLPYSEGGWRYISFMYPTLFVLTYSCHALFTGKRSLIYYLSLLALVPLVLFAKHLNDFISSPAYGFTLLLTAFLLLGHQKTGDNASFARHCVKLFANVAFSFVIGMLLIGTFSAIYHSVVYIFDWSSSIPLIEYVAHFTFYLFAPLFFCRLQHDKEADWNTLPSIVQFVLNFILVPAIIIYTVILYIYFLTIAIQWELPKGGVAYMVMAFILVSLVGRISQLIVSQRLYDWFFRPFGIIAIPPLLLFWIGTVHRICAYSLTESRVYLLASGVLMTLYVFFLYSKRLGNYRLMLFVSSAVIVLLTYIPGISARSIGLQSQSYRMECLARKLSLWDATTGKLTATENFHTKDTALIYAARQLDACYSYLESVQGSTTITARFGNNELHSFLQEYTLSYFSRPDDDIQLEGYTRYLSNCQYNTFDGDKLEIRQNGHLLLEADLDAHFARYKEEISSWQGQATSAAPFCFRNDSCMVFVEVIERGSDGTCRLQLYGTLQVFCN